MLQTCVVVYGLQCPDCDQHYITETVRLLGMRVKEHLSCRKPISSISEHKLKTGLRCSTRNVKILVF